MSQRLVTCRPRRSEYLAAARVLRSRGRNACRAYCVSSWKSPQWTAGQLKEMRIGLDLFGRKADLMIRRSIHRQSSMGRLRRSFAPTTTVQGSRSRHRCRARRLCAAFTIVAAPTRAIAEPTHAAACDDQHRIPPSSHEADGEPVLCDGLTEERSITLRRTANFAWSPERRVSSSSDAARDIGRSWSLLT